MNLNILGWSLFGVGSVLVVLAILLDFAPVEADKDYRIHKTILITGGFFMVTGSIFITR